MTRNLPIHMLHYYRPEAPGSDTFEVEINCGHCGARSPVFRTTWPCVHLLCDACGEEWVVHRDVLLHEQRQLVQREVEISLLTTAPPEASASPSVQQDTSAENS